MVEITFGSIKLVFDGQTWWLAQHCGEAMGLGEAELEKLLQDYYAGNFS